MTVQFFGLGVAIWIAVLKVYRRFGLRTTRFLERIDLYKVSFHLEKYG